MGGEEPARTYIEAALKSGRHVVTANKEVMAKHGAGLLQLAYDHGVRLLRGTGGTRQGGAQKEGGEQVLGKRHSDLLQGCKTARIRCAAEAAFCFLAL